MWRLLIGDLYPDAEFSEPAKEAVFWQIEKALGLPVPLDLVELLRETNGVANEYGDAVVWSAERIVEDNLAIRAEPDYRELYAPFDDLLFFGDSDMGPQFAYVHTGYGAGIVVWDHETDERTLTVVSLRDYLVRCFNDGNDWFR
ncbi:SMI1/KNR4 family protein [Nocardiopsis ansamitocini]|uniref:SMI1/KNR4 family protein n=1 Tax=Nocardiopsis ansamitocini TaxID=1670832 RepID=UPI00255530B2|nr:SMI1/KNR4 family protein [Nocardiopsis ansamitocini]